MPAMKLTPNAAMRARDVSRPSAEHLADAEAAEARMAGGSRARAGDAGKGSAGTQSPGMEGTARPEPDEARAGRAAGAPAAAGDDRGRITRAGGDDRGGITRAGGDDRGGRAGFPRRRRGRPSR